MKSKSALRQRESNNNHESYSIENTDLPAAYPATKEKSDNNLTEILFITSYPPRECGIATYSQDLLKSLNNKFSNSLALKVCALETGDMNYKYPAEVTHILKTSDAESYRDLAHKINDDRQIRIIVIQHEFGFFNKQEQAFLNFLREVKKPVIVAFHTVLPKPDSMLKYKISSIATLCQSLIVMTHNSAAILMDDYDIPEQKISLIAHGTHLVPHLNKEILKNKYGLSGRKVLTTFGLLSSGKSIETTLFALPRIIARNPEVIFLVIGKTHPEVVKSEGEEYRKSLENIVTQSGISAHVKFINSYLSLPELLEYLQLTDIYLFTTNDPNQAVSGTFAYAMSCGCPIISTPIPHAKEVLTSDTGIIFDFLDSEQLADSVLLLLNDTNLRRDIRKNTLQKIVSTAWENSAVRHTMLFKKLLMEKMAVQFNLPRINLAHLNQMTTDTGMIQFCRINQPDLCSGYTLDDNARALVAMSMHYILVRDNERIWYINKYLGFIRSCLQPDGRFKNYVDIEGKFTSQNDSENLDDANGRAIWALGYLISCKSMLPDKFVSEASVIIKKVFPYIKNIHSSRAMAFAIKGLYYYQKSIRSSQNVELVKILADRLVSMYKNESADSWRWFEEYLTYDNSILPEAMLYAWLLTGESIYKKIAVSSLNFLLSVIFNENGIEVVSNKTWLKKGQAAGHFGEQPIDVACTIMTLSKFYDAIGDEDYLRKMEIAFNWFLGSNRLNQVVYNPCTGGCYDGLEESYVNLNQGAESTVSYLLARLTVEKYSKPKRLIHKVMEIDKYDVETIGITENNRQAKSYYFIGDSFGMIKKKVKRSRTWD